MPTTLLQQDKTQQTALSADELERRRLSIQKQWSPVELHRRADLARVRTEQLIEQLFCEDFAAQSA
jgi:hypothetical protein